MRSSELLDNSLDIKRRICFRGTRNRRIASRSDFYIIKLNRLKIDELSLGKWGVLVYEHPICEINSWNNLGFPTRLKRSDAIMTTMCRIEPLDEVADFSDIIENHSLGEIDQTLRNALGIPFTVGIESSSIEIYIYPLKLLRRQKINDYINKILGRRYIFHRVCSGFISDIEKKIIRLPEQSFDLLGTVPGSKVVVQRPVAVLVGGKLSHFVLSSHRVLALSATDAQIEKRRDFERIFPSRYFPAERLLYDYRINSSRYEFLLDYTDPSIEPDIPRVFADKEIRQLGATHVAENEATPFTAIAVRRGVREIFLRDAPSISISILLSTMPLIYQIGIAQSGDYLGSIIVAFVLVFLILIAFAYRVRRQVK